MAKVSVYALVATEDPEACQPRDAREAAIGPSEMQVPRVGTPDSSIATMPVSALAFAHVSSHLMDSRLGVAPSRRREAG